MAKPMTAGTYLDTADVAGALIASPAMIRALSRAERAPATTAAF